MESCVFEVDISLNFTLCFMNLVILNEYHLILRTMNETKETQEVMMLYRGVSSPPVKPILLFSSGFFYNILFLKSHCEAFPTKGCKMLKLPVGKCSSALWSCLSFESSVGDCSTLWMLAVSLQGAGGSFVTALLLLPQSLPWHSQGRTGESSQSYTGGTLQKWGSAE